MSRISRYVLSQLLLTFMITLAGMTFVLMFGIIVKEITRFGLGLDAIARLLPYATPIALRFAVPASILLATCSVFGRMSADNEVVAAKSLGVSPRSIIYPAFALSIAISMGMIWINDVALTWGVSGVTSVIFGSVEEVVFRKLKTERSFRNKHFSINVKDVVGRKLVEPRFEIRGDQSLVVEAREAELQSDLEAQQLRILLTDYSAEIGTKVHTANSGTYTYEVPLSEATMKDRSEPSASHLGWKQISSAAIKQKASIRGLEQQLAARAAFQMVLGDFPQLQATTKHADNKTWNKLHKQHAESKFQLNRMHLEPWRRVAEGFSCLFIVLVGAPLAVQMRTTNFFTTFAMCFFPVLCLYYPILTWTVNRVKDGAIPPYSVWLGNLVLLVVSYFLTRKVVRY